MATNPAPILVNKTNPAVRKEKREKKEKKKPWPTT
jgi:hypothetical protein